MQHNIVRNNLQLYPGIGWQSQLVTGVEMAWAAADVLPVQCLPIHITCPYAHMQHVFHITVTLAPENSCAHQHLPQVAQSQPFSKRGDSFENLFHPPSASEILSQSFSHKGTQVEQCCDNRSCSKTACCVGVNYNVNVNRALSLIPPL